MKTPTLAIATLMALALTPAHADQTNLVQNISIQLYGVQQGNSSTAGNHLVQSVNVVREDTRRVIQALAASTANTLSSTSKLVLVTPLDGGAASVQLRDGGSPVDVTGFFLLQPLSASVQSLQSGFRGGRALQTDYFIERFVLQDGAGYTPLTAHFDVNGFAVQTTAAGFNGQHGSDLTVEVSGSGDLNGSLVILQGTITILGHTLEVVPDSGGAGLLN